MITEKLNVTGMTCGGCVTKLSSALSAIAGVDAVNVSLATNTAEVSFDEKSVTDSTLQAAIRAAGFDVVSDQAKPPTAGAKGCCCG